MTLVVFPVPGGPDKIMFGRFPISAIAFNLWTASWLPTTSDRFLGRYFSIHGDSNSLGTGATAAGVDEDDEDEADEDETVAVFASTL